MYITIVSAECAPVAKAGGLGDFVHGLARELDRCGHEVEIVLPKYDSLRWAHIADLHKSFRDLWVPFHGEWLHCDVELGWVDGLRCLFIDAHSPQNFFLRGRIYGEPDDFERFAFFSRAVLEYLHKSHRQPDIIHCNDWHTALVPVLLYEVYEGLGMNHPRVCFTLHNVGYQGVTGPSVLHQVGLDPRRLMSADRLLDPANPQALNLLKGGIVFSNFVTTVSPRYAWEVRHSDQGMGLQAVLQAHEDKFGGVLNGIDYGLWNPATDPAIFCPYDPSELPGKACNKAQLRRQLGLAESDKPLVGVVSRLDRQKGVELIRHGIHYALESGAQVVLLGSALDPAIDAQFRHLKRETEGSPDCHLELAYDEDLSHRIYAAADIILIPSLYEPCGLTQMIAMKYGVVPVVHRVGGLADTVTDANFSDAPFETRNGYVFDEPTPAGLESALSRALGLWFEHPEYFRQLRINGMNADYSWSRSGERYLEIYEAIRV